MQDQQQQNEQPQDANTEASSPVTVDSSSDVHSSQPKQLHSNSVSTGMYLQLHIHYMHTTINSN